MNERERQPISNWIAINAGLVVYVFIALAVSTRPGDSAEFLGLERPRFSNTIFDIAVFSAMIALLVLASRLILRFGRQARAVRRLHGAQLGTVMVEFTLVFPIILLVMGMVIQLALFANASLIVRYAAFSSARVASVSYTRTLIAIEESIDLEPEKIDQAAHLVLASISPATGGNDAQAALITRFQSRQNGVWGSRSYAQRMNYARAATTVTIDDRYPPANFVFASVGNVFAPKEVEVTIRYQYLITIPGLYNLPGLSTPAPGGVSGRVINIEQTVTLQTTGARESSPVSLLGGSPLL